MILGGVAFVIAVSLSAQAPQAQEDGPRYENGTSLVRPADYREWPFLGSGLGLTYLAENASARTSPNFTNVFVNPSAYRAFMQSGRWPNRTVFVLEARGSRTESALTKDGRFQGDLLGLEAEVKDDRFPDGWAFFNFGRGAAMTDIATPVAGEALGRCVECHTQHTAVERTFVQFYPTLLEVARQKGTLKPGF
jgi:hypothetical protein